MQAICHSTLSTLGIRISYPFIFQLPLLLLLLAHSPTSLCYYSQIDVFYYSFLFLCFNLKYFVPSFSDNSKLIQSKRSNFSILFLIFSKLYHHSSKSVTFECPQIFSDSSSRQYLNEVYFWFSNALLIVTSRLYPHLISGYVQSYDLGYYVHVNDFMDSNHET